MTWFICPKIGHKVSEEICEARKKKGRCVTKETSKGRGSKKVTTSSCEPKGKKSEAVRFEDSVLEMALNSGREEKEEEQS